MFTRATRFALRTVAATALVASIASLPLDRGVVASAQDAPPLAVELDPVGRYELATKMRGKEAVLTAKITKLDDGALGGELSGNTINTVKIIDIRVADSVIKFSVNATEEIRADFRMLIHGDSVTGEWSMPGDGSEIRGRRVR